MILSPNTNSSERRLSGLKVIWPVLFQKPNTISLNSNVCSYSKRVHDRNEVSLLSRVFDLIEMCHVKGFIVYFIPLNLHFYQDPK